MTRQEAEAEALDHKPIWVNAYSVSRNYGGPEEGGWWWDSGEPIASVPLKWGATQEEIDAEKKRLKELIGWESRHDRFSVLGGADFVIEVDDKPGESWPKERPHYE